MCIIYARLADDVHLKKVISLEKRVVPVYIH
jgi:hypothetical protein